MALGSVTYSLGWDTFGWDQMPWGGFAYTDQDPNSGTSIYTDVDAAAGSTNWTDVDVTNKTKWS